ncbi:MAG: hypothetical protein BGO55_17325 [Sphingobacteriales bacterium 50-39]|nr:hypothetical protein [Sphingobacteriales bacterium]OJW59824.1 MAG: hypothetical protein BGO55_17325 [Sphingobacteriales bacterium 50-39]
MNKSLVNQVLNVFWTLLCFAPIVWYWYLQGLHMWSYLFMAFSVSITTLPETMFEKLRFFKHRRQYEKWKIKAVRWFVQDGTLAKKFNKSSEQSFFITTIAQAKQYLTTISMYERFHWMCLLFFLLSSIHSFVLGKILLGVLITLANIFYNFASLMLQQYNKLRINSLPLKAK